MAIRMDPGTLAAIGSGDSSSSLLSPAIVSPSTLVDWGYPELSNVADGGLVDTAPNLVTAANNYTAAATARPTMQRGPNGISNRAAFLFDGAANTMVGASGLLPAFNNVPGVSMLAVMQFASATPAANMSILDVGVNGNVGLVRAAMRVLNTNLMQVGGRRLDADASNFTNGGALTAAPMIVLVVVDFVAGKQRIWINGGTAASAEGALASSGGNCSATDASVVRIGALSGSLFFAGKLGGRSQWASAIASTASATLSGDVLTLIRSWGVSYGITTA